MHGLGVLAPSDWMLLLLNPLLQAKLDALDCGKRLCTGWESWHTFDDPEEGGALKPSKVL